MGNENRVFTVDIVVPCFNEEESLPQFFEAYLMLIQNHPKYAFSIIVVDNGSTDGTLGIVKKFISTTKNGICLELSRNFGKEASLTAGLERSTSDIVIPIDADLQDPIELIPILLERWEQTGADVVLARRKTRAEDTRFRRSVSKFYISLFRKLSDVDLPPNVGEFRLMKGNVVQAFSAMPERQRFVRGMLAWLGFKIEIVDYIRPAREQGKSSFNFFRLFELGIQGITAFSIKPLRMATIFGLVIAISSGFYAIYIFSLAISNKTPIPGYASILITVLFLGGIQLLFLGVIGEYLGRVLLESKARPNYVIREVHQGHGH
jgi:glycosyltransferase involved in cell wall biosynthesis